MHLFSQSMQRQHVWSHDLTQATVSNPPHMCANWDRCGRVSCTQSENYKCSYPSTGIVWTLGDIQYCYPPAHSAGPREAFLLWLLLEKHIEQAKVLLPSF